MLITNVVVSIVIFLKCVTFKKSNRCRENCKETLSRQQFSTLSIVVIGNVSLGNFAQVDRSCISFAIALAI